jgi:hypothetical protein
VISLRETPVLRGPKKADAVLRDAMASALTHLTSLLDRLEGFVRAQRRMRQIPLKDATLTGLAESPHLTVCLSEDEVDQARAIERAAEHESEPALF